MGKGYCNSGSTKTKSRTIIVPDIEIDKERWCSVCQQYVNINLFYGDASRGAGISFICKSCDKKKRVIRKQRERSKGLE